MANLEVQDIWFKSQRVLRTIVQVGIPAFITFALVLPQIISALGLPVDGPVYLWLIGAAGVVTAIAGALSRVMAIPAVNAWLTRLGLGSVPKSEASPAEDLSHLTVNGEPVEPVTNGALVANDGLTTDQTK